jgi:hypothetical protein
MPKSTNQTSVTACENLLNRSLANMQGIERRWKHLDEQQRNTILAALRQAVERVADSDNRKTRVSL